MLWVEGTIIKEGLVLLNSGWEWHIIFLLPSTEWVEQEDWVLVASLEELFPSVLQEEHVSVVEWVPHLESVDGISISSFNLISNLSWSVSVVVKSIIELDVYVELHAGSTHQKVALSVDP